MAVSKRNVLPKKDISKVKRDIKEIKREMRISKPVKTGSSLKLIPKNDVKKVKRDISAIRKTLNRVVVHKRGIKETKFDNYYDLMPHKRIKKLEKQVNSLKGAIKKRDRERASAKKRAKKQESKTLALEKSMNHLSRSINNLMRLFEIAEKDKTEIVTGETGTTIRESVSSSVPAAPQEDQMAMGTEFARSLAEIKARLGELSMENEQMAKGILVTVELLKEGVPMKKGDENPGNIFDRNFLNKIESSANGSEQLKDGDLPPLPPLDNMPEAPSPNQGYPQDKKTSLF